MANSDDDHMWVDLVPAPAGAWTAVYRSSKAEDDQAEELRVPVVGWLAQEYPMEGRDYVAAVHVEGYPGLVMPAEDYETGWELMRILPASVAPPAADPG